jgi:hypothetical protein
MQTSTVPLHSLLKILFLKLKAQIRAQPKLGVFELAIGTQDGK